MRDLQTMPTRDLPRGYARVSADPWHAHALRSWLSRAERRGEIQVVRPIHRTPDGSVHATYRQIRPPMPAWVKPAALLGVSASVVTGILYVAARAARAIADSAGLTVGFSLIALGIILLAVARRRPGGGAREFSGTFKGTFR